MYLLAGSLSISQGTIIGNKALNGNGGGVADYAGAAGSLTLSGVTFKSNSVGGLKTSGPNGVVVAGAGGGLYVVKGSTVSFNGCSFTNDKATYGNGVAVETLPNNVVTINGWPTVTDNDDRDGDPVPVR